MPDEKHRIATEMRIGRSQPADAEAAARMLYGMALGSRHICLLLGAPCPEEIAVLARDAMALFLSGARPLRVAGWPPIRMPARRRIVRG